MKQYKQLLSVLCLSVVCTACEIDNYDAPNGGLYGRIWDVEAGENVPQAVPSDGGLRLRFYEANRENSMEQHFYARQDGSFENTRIFNGPIRLVAEQRNFFPIDTLNVLIKGQTQQDIPVVPYARIRIESMEVEDIIKMQVLISRSERQSYANHKITQALLLWHASPYIDNQKENYTGRVSQTFDAVPDEQILNKHYSVALDLSTTANRDLLKSKAHLIRGNGNTIYLRLGVVTTESGESGKENYTNYSEVYPVEIPPSLLQ
jgi:hypothetical protein